MFDPLTVSLELVGENEYPVNDGVIVTVPYSGDKMKLPFASDVVVFVPSETVAPYTPTLPPIVVLKPPAENALKAQCAAVPSP